MQGKRRGAGGWKVNGQKFGPRFLDRGADSLKGSIPASLTLNLVLPTVFGHVELLSESIVHQSTIVGDKSGMMKRITVGVA
eukprot:2370537-Rhodomonas_salina.1